MTGFVLRALLSALGLWLATVWVPGVHIDNVQTLLLAGLLLGVVNAIVRPIVFVLTLPATIVTLGLFLLRGGDPHLDDRVDHGTARLGPHRAAGLRALRPPALRAARGRGGARFESARREALDPAVEKIDHRGEADPAQPLRGVLEGIPHQADRKRIAAERDERGEDDRQHALADDET
jgi:hypothetical protein